MFRAPFLLQPVTCGAVSKFPLVTWGNGNMGVSGTISDANSLIGSNPGDEVGSLQLWLVSRRMGGPRPQCLCG
jgi:hypothetical protein